MNSTMRWTEQLIAAHKKSLSERAPDRREDLIAHWERLRGGESPDGLIDKALKLLADGNANEIELGIHVLMDLALTDSSLCAQVSELAHHRSATVRRGLAFHLSRSFPAEFQRAVYETLLRDKAASVRVQTIERIGMIYFKSLLPELRTLRGIERNKKVIEALKYWIPMLEVGYRVEPSLTPGMVEITALTGNGIASTCVKMTDKNDQRILCVVEDLRSGS